ncbi:LGT_TIGR03299, phage/plasmid-like protein TIGR03299 [uncultured Caudovirales phage]|uniref:LGT_TIGR03299, phage/plasmid-like protein TIGR03299 n=1 Tax=uncultured Caudovirales phage TaxID=2100421 RepID=A0A6J7WS66_9CAUD|nr:LGT_TIGR03299, phage/plasmid-like protein TIGR03299 [uncultured Caudovirales phage]
MAHLVETMAYAGETPWHGLGVKVLGDLTPDQMLKKAGLDWTVSKQPTYVKINGEEVMTEQQALVRSSDNSILTMVSDDWKPVQNHEAFEFFNDFVMQGEMAMDTAGSLKQGRNVWALAKVKDSFEILGGDRVDSYLLFSNPHQYGRCIDIRFTPIRVVCNNTLTLSLAGSSDLMVRLNHRRSFDGDLVRNTLGIASKKLGTYKDMAQFLSSKNFTSESVVSYLKDVFPSLTKKDNSVMSRPATQAFEVLETQPGAEYGKGTFWQAFNAVTYTTDHLLGHSEETRLASAWYGSNRQRKLVALEKAVEYAEAA